MVLEGGGACGPGRRGLWPWEEEGPVVLELLRRGQKRRRDSWLPFWLKWLPRDQAQQQALLFWLWQWFGYLSSEFQFSPV